MKIMGKESGQPVIVLGRVHFKVTFQLGRSWLEINDCIKCQKLVTNIRGKFKIYG